MRTWSNRLGWMTNFVALFLLYVPLICIVAYSFYHPLEEQWTLEWYRKTFSNPLLMKALYSSLIVASASTIGSVLLGTGIALALERTKFKGKKLLHFLIHIPLIMPELVTGLSLLIWFVLIHLSLGYFSIILAHISFSTSYVVITVRTRLAGFDTMYEEAGRDLGATPSQVFWKVTLPLIWPSIVSGALIAFTLSFDDFLITFFTSGMESDTLPLRIYSMIKFGWNPEINALSSLVLLLTFALAFLSFRPQKFKNP